MGTIVPIVEGFSEVESIPMLLRRLIEVTNCDGMEVGKPFRVRRNRVVKPGELEKAVELACMRDGCTAIILILDADDDCPKELSPPLVARLLSAAAGLPV